jgi:hypothetical protein
VAPASGAEPDLGTHQLVRIFCDADVLIAGAASTRGASHILLRLSELTLVGASRSRFNVGARCAALRRARPLAGTKTLAFPMRFGSRADVAPAVTAVDSDAAKSSRPAHARLLSCLPIAGGWPAL